MEPDAVKKIPSCRQKINANLFALSFATIGLFSSQNLVAANLSAIARDLNVHKDVLASNTSFSFAILSLPFTLLLGLWSDSGRYTRYETFLFTLTVSMVSCVGTAWASAVLQIYFFQFLLGLAQGSGLAVIFALVADLFPEKRRSAAAAMLTGAMGAGLLGGQLTAGILGVTYGWRFPFIACAMVALASMSAFTMIVADPQAGNRASRAAASRRGVLRFPPGADALGSRGSSLFDLLNCRTNLLLVLQGFPGSMPWGMIMIYLNDFLTKDKGLSIVQATAVIAVFGAGAALGSVGGGFLGQRLHNRCSKYVPLLMGMCTMMGFIPMYWLINGHKLSKTMLHSNAFMAGALVNVTGSNVRAVLLNVNYPDTRGTILTLANLLNGLGRGAGPMMTSGLISYLGDRTSAVNTTLSLWLVCGIMILMSSATLHEDELRVQKAAMSEIHSHKKSEPTQRDSFLFVV